MYVWLHSSACHSKIYCDLLLLEGYPYSTFTCLLQLSRSVILTCASRGYSIVLAILLIYKCIYLCVGLLFAFETRKVNIEALNDARFIGLSVYCCVLTCIPLMPIGILLSSQQQARYGVLAGGIFFAVTVILCLLFVPKVKKDRLEWRVEY